MPNPAVRRNFTFKLYDDDFPAAQAAHYTRDVEWHGFILLRNNWKAHSPSSLVTSCSLKLTSVSQAYLYDPSRGQKPPPEGSATPFQTPSSLTPTSNDIISKWII